VQSVALDVRQIVAFVIGHEIVVVPSGRVVGSSKTSRPFSTRARRGLIRLRYDFHGHPASAPSRSRVTSDWRSEDEMVPDVSFSLEGSRRDASARAWAPDAISGWIRCWQRSMRQEMHRTAARHVIESGDDTAALI
jgi:hypothetical protein